MKTLVEKGLTLVIEKAVKKMLRGILKEGKCLKVSIEIEMEKRDRDK